MIKIWKNTNTIDEYLRGFDLTSNSNDAEIAVIGSKSLNLNDFSSLKAVFKCGVGTDNIQFRELEERNIKVWLPSTTTQKIIFEETANFTTFSILNYYMEKLGDVGSWTKYQRNALNNVNVLVIGTGRIGSLVVKKCSQFFNVLKYDIMHNTIEELNDLISKADVITLHIPLNKDTEGWWDSSKLSIMRKGSILVNTSRGQIVNEISLHEKISEGKIKAIFDVFWEEPYNGPLKMFFPNYFRMTPHIASNVYDFIEGLGEDFLNYIERFNNFGD